VQRLESKAERRFDSQSGGEAVFLYRRIDSSVESFISIGQDENNAERFLIGSLSINRANEFVRKERFLGDKEDSQKREPRRTAVDGRPGRDDSAPPH